MGDKQVFRATIELELGRDKNLQAAAATVTNLQADGWTIVSTVSGSVREPAEQADA